MKIGKRGGSSAVYIYYLLLLQVLLACLATVAIAAPQLPVAQVLRQEQVDNDGTGIFRYVVEADNGIYVAATGTPGSQGQVNHEGSYR